MRREMGKIHVMMRSAIYLYSKVHSKKYHVLECRRSPENHGNRLPEVSILRRFWKEKILIFFLFWMKKKIRDL